MLKSLEINGFKSFGSKSKLVFDAPKSVIVGPNGSGKSNAAEAFRFVLGEQSLKTLRARNSDELLFNGGNDGRRANRASVKAVLNNTDNHLDIEYNEVVIERIVQRGDASKYRINGSQVRLKDVTDLLADANIGTSRHHIISQGEADKVLNINERDRKSLIEDALGLQRFYRKRREAIRKLERTEENLDQIKKRRQDLQPELTYLRKQKERIEKTKQIREGLTDQYQKYFKRESILISTQEEQLEMRRKKHIANLESLENNIKKVEQTLRETTQSKDEPDSSRDEITRRIHAIVDKQSAMIEELGRVDGQIQALERQEKREAPHTAKVVQIPTDSFDEYKDTFTTILNEAESVDNANIRAVFDRLRSAVTSFLSDFSQDDEDNEVSAPDNTEEIAELKKKRNQLQTKRDKLSKERKELETSKEEQEKNVQKQESQQHQADKELLKFTAEKEKIETELKRINSDIDMLEEAKEDLEDEKAEAKILCGPAALKIDDVPLVDQEGNEVSEEGLISGSTHRSRHAVRRALERSKIKLEETRVSDEQSVLQEHDRVAQQVEFLDGELDDLRSSKESLLNLVEEIETTVAEKFRAGVKEINAAFGDFFRTMFGGGAAELFITEHPKGKGGLVENLEEEPDETEEGIRINIQLPNKKIRGLGVLSGGERSLVSIALLFALSQINPPPFVVLDEADAALDEANSRRFGDMIDRLSNRSQLIIITHNRETMARADILYGVTMDQVGGSRLLSLNLSDAVEAVEN